MRPSRPPSSARRGSYLFTSGIADRHSDYAQKIGQKLRDERLRIEIKDEQETVSKKIREGELQKIPYLLIIGDREVQAQSVSVRQRKKGDLGAMQPEIFVKRIKEEVEQKA